MSSNTFRDAKKFLEDYKKWADEYIDSAHGITLRHQWQESRDGRFILILQFFPQWCEDCMDFEDKMVAAGFASSEIGPKAYLAESVNGLNALEDFNHELCTWVVGDGDIDEEEETSALEEEKVSTEPLPAYGIYKSGQIGLNSLKEKLLGRKVRSIVHRGSLFIHWYLIVEDGSLELNQEKIDFSSLKPNPEETEVLYSYRSQVDGFRYYKLVPVPIWPETWQQVEVNSLKIGDRVKVTGKFFQRASGLVIYLDASFVQIEFDEDFPGGHNGFHFSHKKSYPNDKKIMGAKNRWNFKRDGSEGFAFEYEDEKQLNKEVSMKEKNTGLNDGANLLQQAKDLCGKAIKEQTSITKKRMESIANQIIAELPEKIRNASKSGRTHVSLLIPIEYHQIGVARAVSSWAHSQGFSYQEYLDQCSDYKWACGEKSSWFGRCKHIDRCAKKPLEDKYVWEDNDSPDMIWASAYQLMITGWFHGLF